MAAACRLVRLAKQVRRSLLTREANASMRRIARFSCGGEDTRLAGRPFRDSSRRVISPDELETHEYPGILARFSVPPGRGLIDGATQRHQKMACFVCRWNRSVKKLLRACLARPSPSPGHAQHGTRLGPGPLGVVAGLTRPDLPLERPDVQGIGPGCAQGPAQLTDA